MNRDQIALIMDPLYSVVYTMTNAPVKLVFRDNTIKVGYFQPHTDSVKLELENKYTFVGLTDTKDQVSIIDGGQLINVQYPSKNGNDLEGLRFWNAYDVLKVLKISPLPASYFSQLLVEFRNSYLDSKNYSYRRSKHRNPVEVDQEILSELLTNLQHIQNRPSLLAIDEIKKAGIRLPAAIIETWQSDKNIRSLYDAVLKYNNNRFKEFNSLAVHIAEYRSLDKLATILRRKIHKKEPTKRYISESPKTKKLVQMHPAPKNEPVSVFVSYSWDGKDHEQKVMEFTDHLRKKGFKAQLDKMISQEETAINFKKMMFNSIHSHEKIVVVLSEGYKKKADSFTGGVGDEYELLISDISVSPRKYVFVSFGGRSDSIIPFGMRNRDIIDLSLPDGENALIRKLSDQPAYIFSDVATEVPNLPPKQIGDFALSINKEFFNSKEEFKKYFKKLLLDKNSAYYSELREHWNTHTLRNDSVVLTEIIQTSLAKAVEYDLLPMINDFVAEHLNYDGSAKYIYNSPHVYMHVREDEGYNLPVYVHICFIGILYSTAIANKIDIDRVAQNSGTMRSIYSSMVKYIVANIERNINSDDLEYPSNYHWLIGEILGITDNWITLFNEPEYFDTNFSYLQDIATITGYCLDELYHGEEAEVLPDTFVVRQVYYHSLSTYFSSLTNDEIRGSFEEHIIKNIPQKLFRRVLKFSLDEKFALSVDQFISGRFRTINDRERAVLERFRSFLIRENLLPDEN